MAHNPLLALLNTEGSSSAGIAPETQLTQSASSVDHQSSVTPPSVPADSTSPRNASDLLQNFFSPCGHSVKPSEASSKPSSEQKPPSQQSSAADLLDLLRSRDPKVESSARLPVSPNAPPSKSTSQLVSPNTAPSRSKTHTPINASASAGKSRSPVPTMFDFASPFDLLHQQPAITPKEGRAKGNGSKDQAPSNQQDKKGKENLASYEVDSKFHASHHLSALRGSSLLAEDESSGVMKTDNDYSFALDLSTPQPGGTGSLYPAKLEMTQISLLDIPFVPQVIYSASSRTGLVYPAQRIGAVEQTVVVYVMNKRIRIIDQETGARVLAKLDEPIQSIFTAKGRTSEHWLLGAISETSIGVWAIDRRFGEKGTKATLIVEISFDQGIVSTFACFRPRKDSLVIALTDGKLLEVPLTEDMMHGKRQGSVASWEALQKNMISSPKFGDRTFLASSMSIDGNFLATVFSAHGSTYVEAMSLTQQKLETTIQLPTIAQHLSLQNGISFAQIIGPQNSCPQAIVIGCEQNTTIGIFSLADGKLLQCFRFDSHGKNHFNHVQWSEKTATLLISNTLRSSVFSLRPYEKPSSQPPLPFSNRGDDLDQANETIVRIQTGKLSSSIGQPPLLLKESALPEPWSSFAIDDSCGSDFRLAASYVSGIQTVILPEEAMRKSASSEAPRKPEDRATQEDQMSLSNKASHTDQTNEVQNNSSPHTIDGLVSELAALETSSHKDTKKNLVVDSITRSVLHGVQEMVRSDLSKIISDEVNRSISREIQQAFLNTDIHAHLKKSVTTALIEPVRKTAMDVVTRSLAPHVDDTLLEMTERIESKMDKKLTEFRKEIKAEQSRALTGSENAQRTSMELFDKLLPFMENIATSTSGLATINVEMRKTILQVRKELNDLRAGLPQNSTNGAAHSTQKAPVQSTPLPDVEDTLLYALSAENTDQNGSILRDKLAELEKAYKSVFMVIFEDGGVRVSQAVLLALMHRMVKELNRVGEGGITPDKSVYWLETCSVALEKSDPSIAQYYLAVKNKMIDGIVQAQRRHSQGPQASWWDRERLESGILYFLR